MNIAELKNMIKDLPDEMQAAIGVNDLILPICPCCTGVGDIQFENDANKYPIFILTTYEEEPEVNTQLN